VCPGGGSFVLTVGNESFVMPHHDVGIVVIPSEVGAKPEFIFDELGKERHTIVRIATPPGTRVLTFTDGVSDAFTKTAENLLLSKVGMGETVSASSDQRVNSLKERFETVYCSILKNPKLKTNLDELVALHTNQESLRQKLYLGNGWWDTFDKMNNETQKEISSLESKINDAEVRLHKTNRINIAARRRIQSEIDEFRGEVRAAREKLQNSLDNLIGEEAKYFAYAKEFAQKAAALKGVLLDVIDSPDDHVHLDEVDPNNRRLIPASEFKTIGRIAEIIMIGIGRERLFAGKEFTLENVIDEAIQLSHDDISGTEYVVPMPEERAASSSNAPR
jgi:hypothetical protein